MAVFVPQFAHASGSSGPAATSVANSANARNNSNSNNQQARQQAQQMVPARAYLNHTIDASQDKTGQAIQATLSDTVHLKNGKELPHGTVLTGSVVTNHMSSSGPSQLAVRFDNARLKDGTTVPIKATIVGVYGARSENDMGAPIVPGHEQPNTWTPGYLQIDQIRAAGNVDLHSRIASRNSGVFVTNKDNVKVDRGSEIAFAIAPASGASASSAGSGGR